MKKKIFAILTAVFLLCACLPLGAVSVSAATYGDLSYEIEDGKVTIWYCNKNVTSVEIPSTIEGYPVTTIGLNAFFNCDSLTSVTIPDSVTSIGLNAFYGCTSLTSITIPDSVTTIEHGAFSGCVSLTSINVVENNSNYCDVNGVLFNKSKTTLIRCPGGKSGAYTIPDSVTTIGREAFSDCTSLTSITIPDSVTTIGGGDFRGGVFAGCTALTSVTIPDSVTTIEENAFYGCTSLTDVYYVGSETDRAAIQIGEENGALDSATWHYNHVIEQSSIEQKQDNKEENNDKDTNLVVIIGIVMAVLLVLIITAVVLMRLKKKKSAE